MKCPHCRVAFSEGEETRILEIGKDVDGWWAVESTKCPECNRFAIRLKSGKSVGRDGGKLLRVSGGTTRIVNPPGGASRPRCPSEVPKVIAEDYDEACRVLPDSAKASAALSRRCLQSLLRGAAGVKAGNLADEIQEVLDSGSLPSHLSDGIDAVRNIGNFAAHPTKSQQTGTIVPVEPGEAEWNLEILEALFDFYYVQPKRLKERRAALNKKLEDAGKPPMKSPSAPD